MSERYRGQRLPDSQTLRNVLEREFQVEHSRVQQAERMLLDSARDAHLLKHRGDGTYLVVSDAQGDEPGEFAPGVADGAVAATPGGSRFSPSQPAAPAPVNTISFSLEEIGGLSADDFEIVWRAIGILVRARSNRQTTLDDQDWDDI